ncbi:hypothetical protein MHYP_G00257920 [Metynnis hypsauchen]
MLPALLYPALPDAKTIARKENERRILDAKCFSMHHRARDFSKLLPGEEVWVTDAKASESVVASYFTPRSYLVNTPQGTIRSNRYHLIPMQTAVEGSDSPTYAQSSTPVQEQSPVAQQLPMNDIPELLATSRTRSGRVNQKPTRLDL